MTHKLDYVLPLLAEERRELLNMDAEWNGWLIDMLAGWLRNRYDGTGDTLGRLAYIMG